MVPPDIITTKFAPAERAGDEEVLRQCRHVADLPLLCRFLDAVPDILMALNGERQIVYANRSLLDFLGVQDLDAVRGRRPGEVLGCEHASDYEAGCGTTEFCQTCGAVKAILASQNGKHDVQECRVTRRDGDALDLRVWTTPVKVGEEDFTLFALMDISHEKRRRALERIFFHDVMNTAGGLKGFAQLLREATPDEVVEFSDLLQQLSTKLIEELNAQRDLMAAENGELSVQPEPVRTTELLEEVAGLYRSQEIAKDRQICIDSGAQDSEIVTCRALLRRVIGNMLKNALEASNAGETMTLGCDLQDDTVELWVHNPNPMPRDVQLQVFQRSFSTKGTGRGLGTYSIKLLSERYLKGRVSFASTPDGGTTFRANYPLSLEG